MFFIIWKGWGILAPLIIVLFIVLGLSVGTSIPALNHHDNYLNIFIGIMILIAAVICWFWGNKLNNTPPRELIDAKTGQKILFKRTHSCFFIPFQYWSIIAALCAVLFFVMAF